MPLDFRHTRYLKSAHASRDMPLDEGLEVAFAGRSNAGKSSAINAITGVRGLARTSKTPGRTQLINFFTVTDSQRLVDLPGYGYAKVPEAVKRHWEGLLEDYLRQRRSLAGLVLVMDVRHPLTAYDQAMLEWAQPAALPVHILLTKADKLSRGAAAKTLLEVKRAVSGSVSVQLLSALKRTGVDEARTRLDTWLSPEE